MTTIHTFVEPNVDNSPVRFKDIALNSVFFYKHDGKLNGPYVKLGENAVIDLKVKKTYPWATSYEPMGIIFYTPKEIKYVELTVLTK